MEWYRGANSTTLDIGEGNELGIRVNGLFFLVFLSICFQLSIEAGNFALRGRYIDRMRVNNLTNFTKESTHCSSHSNVTHNCLKGLF